MALVEHDRLRHRPTPRAAPRPRPPGGCGRTPRARPSAAARRATVSDRRRLELGQVEVAAGGGGAVQVLGEPGPARQVGGGHQRLHPFAALRARGEQRHPGPVRHAARPARAPCENRTAPSGAAAPSAARIRSARRIRYSAKGSGAPGPTTHTVRSTATGGMQAPEPSNTIAPGSIDAASEAPPSTLDSAGSPVRPPPTRRQPTVRHARQHRVLEVVGRGVLAAGVDLEQLGQAHPRGRRARLRRPAAAHADHHRVRAALAQQGRPVAGHGRLPGALAGADHGELGRVGGHLGVDRRVEPGSRQLVDEAEVQGERGVAEPVPRVENRLVGQVHDRARARREPPERAGRVDVDGPSVELVERARRRASPRRRRRPPPPARARSRAGRARPPRPPDGARRR